MRYKKLHPSLKDIPSSDKLDVKITSPKHSLINCEYFKNIEILNNTPRALGFERKNKHV